VTQTFNLPPVGLATSETAQINVSNLAANAAKTDNFATNASSSKAATESESAAVNSATNAAESSSSAKSTSVTASNNFATSHSEMSSETASTSTVASLVASKSDTSSETSVKNLSVVHNIQGAVSIDSAAAKNIAVDGSNINDTNNYSVLLAGAAEQNATALNIVNSAGGMVANGLNIAHTTNLTTMPVLTQTNSITQAR